MSNEEKSFPKTSINWYPGHMAKTKRQIEQDLKLIDVVIEILDARIPLSSQNPDIGNLIEKKKRIVLLNKSDLADEKKNILWKKYFEQKGASCIITNSNSGDGIKDILKEIEKLMSDEMEKQKEKGRIGKNIRIMIVGVPNVGKSSLINRLAKKNSAVVGNKPGVTKQKQWIRIASNIELLDTPGVLWPKFESQDVALNLAYTGTIKDDVIDDAEIACYLLKYLYNNYKEMLFERYKVNDEDINSNEENEMILELMEQIGKKRGALLPGGIIDQEKTARLILDDFRTGKIGRITLENVK